MCRVPRRKSGEERQEVRAGGMMGVGGGGGGVRRERSGVFPLQMSCSIYTDNVASKQDAYLLAYFVFSVLLDKVYVFLCLLRTNEKTKNTHERTKKKQQQKTTKTKQNTNSNNNKTKETKTVSLRRANISDKAAHFDLQNNDFCVRQFLHFIPSLCSEDVKSDVL